MESPGRNLARALKAVLVRRCDLADMAGVSRRTMSYWMGAQRFPTKGSLLRLAVSLRRHAAKMLVTARLMEDMVGAQSDVEVPARILDAERLPEGYTKKDAERYNDIVGQLPDWRRSQLSDYQLFTRYWRGRGLSMEEVAKLWTQKIEEMESSESTDQDRSVPQVAST